MEVGRVEAARKLEFKLERIRIYEEMIDRWFPKKEGEKRYGEHCLPFPTQKETSWEGVKVDVQWNFAYH